jgi:putative phosphoesterase
MKLLVISDIHGNWAALTAVLKTEPDADRILCLGDLVDYGPEPVACVGWALRQQNDRNIFVQGNHDWGVAEKKDPRAAPLYRDLALATQAFCQRVLSDKMQTFLGALPRAVNFQLGDWRCYACHATPSGPLFHYMRGSEQELEHELEAAGWPNFLFVGHTHWPSVRRCKESVILNPGSVGQPKDGDPAAAYAVWEDGKVNLRRVNYPVEATIQSYDSTPLKAQDITALTAVLKTGGDLPS